MDQYVALLQEAQVNLLRKLTEDKKKELLEDSISVVSLQNFREDKMEQEGGKDNSRDLQMILFQFGKQGDRLGQFIQAVVISEIAEILKNKNQSQSNQEKDMIDYEFEIKNALKMVEKENKSFYLDKKCIEIVKQSQILKNLSVIFTFEGIFKPKTQNQKNLLDSPQIKDCIKQWKCFSKAHLDSMEYKLKDINTLDPTNPFILVKNDQPFWINNFNNKCFFLIESGTEYDKQLGKIQDQEPHPLINDHANIDNNNIIATSQITQNNTQEKGQSSRIRQQTQQKYDNLGSEINQQQKQNSSCILFSNNNGKTNKEMEFKPQEKLFLSQEQMQQQYQDAKEPIINNSTSSILYHTGLINNHVSNISPVPISEQQNSIFAKEQTTNDQAATRNQQTKEIQNYSQNFTEQEEQSDQKSNEQMMNEHNNHLVLEMETGKDEEEEKQSSEGCQQNQEQFAYDLLQATNVTDQIKQQKEGQQEQNSISSLKNDTEKNNLENDNSTQNDCSKDSLPKLSDSESSPKYLPNEETDQLPGGYAENMQVDQKSQEQRWKQEWNEGQFGDCLLNESQNQQQPFQLNPSKHEERGTQEKTEEEKGAAEVNKKESNQLAPQSQQEDQPNGIEEIERLQEQKDDQPNKKESEEKAEKDREIGQKKAEDFLKDEGDKLVLEDYKKDQCVDEERQEKQFQDSEKSKKDEDVESKEGKEFVEKSEQKIENTEEELIKEQAQQNQKEDFEEEKKKIRLEEVAQEREKEILSLKEQLKDYKKTEEEKEIQINKLNGQIQEQDSSIISMIKFQTKNTEELDKFKKQKEELEVELRNLKENEKNTATQLASFKEKYCISTNLETKIVEFRNETMELKNKLNGAETTVEKHTDSIKELQEKLQEKESYSQAESESFKQQLQQKNEENESNILNIKRELQGKFSIKETELLDKIDVLEKELVDLQKTHQQNNILAMEKQVEQRKKDIQHQQEQLCKKDQEAEEMKTRLRLEMAQQQSETEGIIKELNSQIEQQKNDILQYEEQLKKTNKEAEDMNEKLKQEMDEQKSEAERKIGELNDEHLRKLEDQKNMFEAQTEHQRLIQEQQDKLLSEKNHLQSQMQATIDEELDRISYINETLHKDFDSLNQQSQEANEYITKIDKELQTHKIASQNQLAQLQKFAQIIKDKEDIEAFLNMKYHKQTQKLISVTAKLNKLEFDTKEVILAPFRDLIRVCSECNKPVPSVENFNGKDRCLDCYNEYLSELY